MQLLLRLFQKPAPRRAQSNRGSPLLSDPELTALWRSVRQDFFPERGDLDTYCVRWSLRRQRRTLASCHIRSRRVVVAKELRDPLFHEHLPALLYHEMCHAALGEDVGYRNGKRAWHGPRFRALESKHPGIVRLDAWIKSGGWAYAVRRSRAIETNLGGRKRKIAFFKGP